jgi:hypothetical protein
VKAGRRKEIKKRMTDREKKEREKLIRITETEKLLSRHDLQLILMIFPGHEAAPQPVPKRLHDDITLTLSA